MTQLRELAVPFPQRAIRTNPSGGGSYVGHHLYAQRLLMHLGGYDFTLVEVLRGDVDAIAPNPAAQSKRAREGRPALHGVVVGVICRLRVVVDGREMVIEDAGDCEQPHNWPHDGARMKDAMSDALKRCCARIGLGIHLYAGDRPDDFFLARVLKDRETSGEGTTGQEAATAGQAPVQADAPPPVTCLDCGGTEKECVCPIQ